MGQGLKVLRFYANTDVPLVNIFGHCSIYNTVYYLSCFARVITTCLDVNSNFVFMHYFEVLEDRTLKFVRFSVGVATF